MADKKKGLIVRIKQFWHDLAVEFRNITWPSPSEVAETTFVVILSISMWTLLIAVLDLLFGSFIKFLAG